jgi:hypothetical protein
MLDHSSSRKKHRGALSMLFVTDIIAPVPARAAFYGCPGAADKIGFALQSSGLIRGCSAS